MLTVQFKRFGFPKFTVPLLKYNPLCVQEAYRPLHVALWELGSRNCCKNANPPATAIAVSNKPSFFSRCLVFSTSIHRTAAG